jgi:glutamate 5-kinase
MKRIVIKVGSAVITQENKLALDRLANLVEFIVQLKKQNKEIILVSSGAVAAGYTLIKLNKNILSNKQVLASVGQPLLLDTYRKEFNKYNILCSQVLLEASDFNDNIRLNHAKDAINGLLQNNIVPIINENDVTAVDELVFGDNDQLSAHITYYFDANLLVILTDIDGYYDDNPHINSNAKLLRYVNYIEENLLNVEQTANTQFATGGIVTKLKAANFLLKKNKSMYLTSGFDLTFVKEFLLKNKHSNGTLFKGKI